MNDEIIGGNLPAVLCQPAKGEKSSVKAAECLEWMISPKNRR